MLTSLQIMARLCSARLRSRVLRLLRARATPSVALALVSLTAALAMKEGRPWAKSFIPYLGLGIPISIVAFRYTFSRAGHREQREATTLFVYGTLKRGMHWNEKFLSRGAQYLGEATTAERFPLVVGRCGVPYLLHDCQGQGFRVHGELWRVDEDTLEGLDQYEGIGKAYYSKPSLRVTWLDNEVDAHAYVMQVSPPALRSLPHHSIYTMECHRARYQAVEHIMLKQQLYLQGKTMYNTPGFAHPGRSIEDDAGESPRDYTARGPWVIG